jgi:hypothetical protein
MKDPYILLQMVIAMALLGLQTAVTIRMLVRAHESRRRRLRRVYVAEIFGLWLLLLAVLFLMGFTVAVVFYPDIIPHQQ